MGRAGAAPGQQQRPWRSPTAAARASSAAATPARISSGDGSAAAWQALAQKTMHALTVRALNPPTQTP